MATALWAAKHGKSPTDAGLEQPTPTQTRRLKEAIYNWRVVIGGLCHCMCHTVARAKARLRQFQSMISSTYDSETSLAMGMLRMAQRWGGLSHPVNMMDTKHLRLLQPVDSTAPQAVHLIAELRELG